jgi:hypothetical protein
MNERAVELVGKGARGGKRAAFSTASAPVRRRRIVPKSTTLAGVMRQPVRPLRHQARGRALGGASFLQLTRTVAVAFEPAFLQGWV